MKRSMRPTDAMRTEVVDFPENSGRVRPVKRETSVKVAFYRCFGLGYLRTRRVFTCLAG